MQGEDSEMSDIETITLVREDLPMSDGTSLTLISCSEIGLYLCYKDETVTYRLVQPLARALLLANKKLVVRKKEDLDLSILRSKSIMLLSFVVEERDAEQMEFDEGMSSLEKYGMLADSDTSERSIFMPYAIETGKEVFYNGIVQRIRVEELKYE